MTVLPAEMVDQLETVVDHESEQRVGATRFGAWRLFRVQDGSPKVR
jgi:hypothetical protein